MDACNNSAGSEADVHREENAVEHAGGRSSSSGEAGVRSLEVGVGNRDTVGSD